MTNPLSKENVASEKWNDWRWQMSNSIRKAENLARWVNLTDDEISAIEKTSKKYKWRVTPYYASLMDKTDPNCPVRLQALPHNNELMQFEDSDVDPVGDTIYRKTNRIVHKYPDRVIFLVTEVCPVYCRHCTRKFHTTSKDGTYFEKSEGVSYELDYQYLEEHPEIKDVLLTGGDPLTYADHKIEALIKRLRQIPHIEIIRIGSRYPVLLPQRITEDFCSMLEKYHPIWLSTHFNHPKELSEDAVAACDRLLRHGVPIQNQTVLLRGINDDVDTMRSLMRGLLRARVKPYYIYHCDNVSGVSHFMTSVEKGREIMKSLLGHMSGYALPRYIVTTKLGKIPLERTYVINEDNNLTVENYNGETMDLSYGMTNVPQPETVMNDNLKEDAA